MNRAPTQATSSNLMTNVAPIQVAEQRRVWVGVIQFAEGLASRNVRGEEFVRLPLQNVLRRKAG